MKKLFLIILILFLVNQCKAQFIKTDTINTTLSAIKYTSVTLQAGPKSLHIHNTSARDLYVGFSNYISNTADTINVYKVFAGNRIHFYYRSSIYMYLWNGGTDVIKTTVDYGEGGQDIIVDPVDANGKIVISGTVTATLDSTKERLWHKIANYPDLYDAIDSLLHVYIMNEVQVKNNYDYARVDKGYYDSCVVDMDTLSRQCDVNDTANSMVSLGITAFWQFLLCPDDTIEFSYLGTFLRGDCFPILPNQSWVSKPLNISSFTNVYWRRKGTTGTPWVQNKGWGY